MAYRIAIVSPASQICGGHIPDRHTATVSSECASNTLESLAAQEQPEVETLPPSDSIPSHEVTLTRLSVDVTDEAQEAQEHSMQDDECVTVTDAMKSSTRIVCVATPQKPALVYTVDEEDAVHQYTSNLSTSSMQSDEEVWDTISPILGPSDTTILGLCVSDAVTARFHESSVVEDDGRVESEDMQYISRISGEQSVNMLSS